jgi:hypothetical protein
MLETQAQIHFIDPSGNIDAHIFTIANMGWLPKGQSSYVKRLHGPEGGREPAFERHHTDLHGQLFCATATGFTSSAQVTTEATPMVARCIT